MSLILNLLAKLLRRLLPLLGEIGKGTIIGTGVKALSSLLDDPNGGFAGIAKKLEEIREVLAERLGKSQDGETTASDQTMVQSIASAGPLSEVLTVLQKKLEEGLCPAIEGLTEKLEKVPDPDFMLGSLTAPAGSGRAAAALGVSPDAFAGLPDSARRFVDEGAMASMTVAAAFVAARDGAKGAETAVNGLVESARRLGGDAAANALLGLGGADDPGPGRPAQSGTEALQALEDVLGRIGGKAGTVGTQLVRAFQNAGAQAGDLNSQLGGVLDALGGIGGKAGRILGILGSLFGGGSGGSGLLSLFGLGKAGGGRIQPGIPTLVGERGPEIVVPSVPASVINGADTRAMGRRARGAPVVNMTNNFTTDVRNSVRAEVLSIAPAIAGAAKQALVDDLRRRR